MEVGVGLHLIPLVVLGRAGGEDFHNKIGGAVDAVRLNLVGVADNHKIRHKMVIIR